MSPNERRGSRARVMLAVLGLLALIGAHGVGLRQLSSSVALPAGVLAVLVAVVAIEHLGLLAPIYLRLRRTAKKPE